METGISLAERLEQRTQGHGQTIVLQLDDLKKSEPARKGTWGGKRSGAGGSKPRSEKRAIERGIKAWIDEHVNGEVDVQIVDSKTGRSCIVKKPRVVLVLQKLYEIGMRDGNVDALSKWLDRAIGKAVQPIAGEEQKKIMLRIDF